MKVAFLKNQCSSDLTRYTDYIIYLKYFFNKKNELFWDGVPSLFCGLCGHFKIDFCFFIGCNLTGMICLYITCLSLCCWFQMWSYALASYKAFWLANKRYKSWIISLEVYAMLVNSRKAGTNGIILCKKRDLDLIFWRAFHRVRSEICA